MGNNRNFFITIALSVAILALWQVFYMNPHIEAQRHARQVEQARQAEQAKTEKQKTAAAGGEAASGSATSPAKQPAGANEQSVPAQEAARHETASRAESVAATRRVRIDTPSLAGSINLVGARLDDLSLKHYHVTVDKRSPIIELLNPGSMRDGYFAELGYVAGKAAGAVPGPNTVWQVKGDPVLTTAHPVTLTYVNDKGLKFTRTISVDDKYMFTVKDQIVNDTGAPVSLSDYGRVARFDKPVDHSSFYLHEGMVGVTGKEGLQEIKYSKIEKEKQVEPGKSTNGWLGFTDKYWAVALVPRDSEAFQPRYGYYKKGRPHYQVDFQTNSFTVAPGQSTSQETLVFAGAKEVATVNAYQNDLHIRQFSLVIDWGYFYFITKPMFWLMDSLYKVLGNFGLAIISTTVILKLAFFPLASKSYRSMANMKKMQPVMKEIREKYADDKMAQQKALMELYKKEKINPIAGCWPMLLQVPVFFALYKVLYITIEMRHAPFFGWIHDLAAPDPTTIFNLFGLLPYAPPAFLPHFGVWPLIMGITMFLQMRMNPTPPDPTQAMIMNWMPLIFIFMLSGFPAGFVIYWACNNTLSVIQQSVIMKQQGVRIELFYNLKNMLGRRKRPKPAE